MDNWTMRPFDQVALLTFTRPPRNYFDFASMEQLADQLEALVAQSARYSVVMLTGGVDGYFVAHGDLADLQRAGRGEAPDGMKTWLRLTGLLRDMPQPVVAAIDGQ